ncbi:MAG: T9SS type A sorting domain-containing protein, partial [Saprospiraceae bacterium]
QTPNDPVANNINGGEHDGSEDPADNGGLLQTVYNATYIGMGQNADNGSGNSGLRIKNAAAITYGNSIFTEFGRFGLDLEDEAVMRYLADDFQFPSNIWWNFGEGNTPEQFVNAETQEAAVITKLLGEGNIVADPLLYNISWTPSTNSGLDGNGTDPRLLSTSPATGNAADVPDGDFYDDVDYRGAFAPDATGSDYWITWTHAFRMGYFVNLPLSTTEFGSNGSGVALSVPAPNPATSTTRMTIDLPAAGLVSATIFDQLGRQISRRDLGLLSAGENNVTLDVQSLPNGNYFIVIDTELGKVAQRVVVNR